MVWRPIVILIAAWSICAGLGLAKMLTFELTPARRTAPPQTWPRSTAISPDACRPTLVLFLHPKCPCSRATLAELERLIATCGDKLTLRIVFVRPADTGDEWENTSLVRAANRIPQAIVSSDAHGIQAAHFGATTSGQVLLYSTGGQLLFQGGLTPSRGHEGDNAGRDAIAALISTGHSSCTQTAVFGCSLTDCPPPSTMKASHARTD